MFRPLRRAATTALVLAALTAAVPAHAVTLPSGPAASADAYGLMADVQVGPSHTPVRQGPMARAAQEYPPSADAPAEAQVNQAGPFPADSSVVNHVGVMSSIAGANALPLGVASAEANDVSLLGSQGNSQITADLVRAQANADCDSDPSPTGTAFVNLRINGTPVENTPTPNTVVNLVGAKVILNEQHPAFDGRGMVVNAIHVISTTTADAAFRGDVIVAHAASTVHCTNGEGTTGDANQVKMTKSASPSAVQPGGTVTYNAKVTNTTGTPCLVTQFIEHLSTAFDYVSTDGDFGASLDRTLQRPSGGSDLILGNGKTIGAGATFTQRFVVKAKDGTAPGVYYNNLEILCANLGDFLKGLDAPVRIGTINEPRVERKPQCSDGIDNDNDGRIDYPTDLGCDSPLDNDERNTTEGAMPRTGGADSLYLLAGVGLVALAVGTRRLRNWIYG